MRRLVCGWLVGVGIGGLLCLLAAWALGAGAVIQDPSPKLTPGAVLTQDKKTVCVPGYAKRARGSISERMRREAWLRYYPGPQPGDWELDHWIAVELGGATVPENLWFQPAEPRPGYHEKDWVENALHALVCAHLMPLPVAQEQSKNWLAIWFILHKDAGQELLRFGVSRP